MEQIQNSSVLALIGICNLIGLFLLILKKSIYIMLSIKLLKKEFLKKWIHIIMIWLSFKNFYQNLNKIKTEYRYNINDCFFMNNKIFV